jgi:hypothetical protein
MNKTKKTSRLQILISLVLLSLLLAAIPSQSVRADTGPKPTLDFVFVSQVKPPPAIVSGKLLQCKDEACLLPLPLGEMGPQRFECGINACNALTYGSSSYYRLEIEFSDGVTRQSNSFTKLDYFANYLVTIHEDGLEVVEKSMGPNVPYFQLRAPTLTDFLATVTFPCLEITLLVVLVLLAVRSGRAGATLASYHGWQEAAWLLAIPAFLVGIMWTRGLIITLVVELLLGTGYVLWKKRSASVILTVILLLNLITQPALWITVSGFSGVSPFFLILFAEGVVWLVEAGGLYLSQRSSMRFREALWVSFALNAASFIVGSLLPI